MSHCLVSGHGAAVINPIQDNWYSFNQYITNHVNEQFTLAAAMQLVQTFQNAALPIKQSMAKEMLAYLMVFR